MSGSPTHAAGPPGPGGATPNTSRGARVDIENVERRFPDTGQVVERLSTTIASGEFLSLLGPSGCGKSTLLRMIAGLDTPDSGKIQVQAGDRRFFRGFVFQESHLLPWRSVLDNAALPLQLMGTPKGEARERARAALAKVGLTDALGRYPSQLSGGMKMRVSVARALVAEPSLLLLDEPFAALDEHIRHRLQEELRGLWESLKMTVVFVTHSVSEAVFLSDRAIVLSRRPARVLLDRKLELPAKRDAKLRTAPELLREVERLTAAYDEPEVGT